MGDLYVKQAETAKAQATYAGALSGLSNVLGQSSKKCVDLAAKIDGLSLRGEETDADLEVLTVSEESALQPEQKKSSKHLIRRLIKKVF
jgi:hypothetical protein